MTDSAPMDNPPAPMSRRSVLGLAAVAAVAAACRDGHPAARPGGGRSAPHADRAALQQAVAAETDLLSAYDAALAASATVTVPALSRRRDAHATHLAALRRRLGADAPTTTTPGPAQPAAPTAAELHRRERSTVPALQHAAVAASGGDTAALLASIAAAHGTARPAGGGR